MHLLGYMVTLANLQALGGPGKEVNDLSVRVADVKSLADDLRHDPQFSLDNYRNDNFYRNGDVGIYISNSLRDYLFEGKDDGEEGTVITIIYGDLTESPESGGDDAFAHFLLRKEGFNENHAQLFVDKYLDTLKRRG